MSEDLEQLFGDQGAILNSIPGNESVGGGVLAAPGNEAEAENQVVLYDLPQQQNQVVPAPPPARNISARAPRQPNAARQPNAVRVDKTGQIAILKEEGKSIENYFRSCAAKCITKSKYREYLKKIDDFKQNNNSLTGEDLSLPVVINILQNLKTQYRAESAKNIPEAREKAAQQTRERIKVIKEAFINTAPLTPINPDIEAEVDLVQRLDPQNDAIVNNIIKRPDVIFEKLQKNFGLKDLDLETNENNEVNQENPKLDDQKRWIAPAENALYTMSKQQLMFSFGNSIIKNAEIYLKAKYSEVLFSDVKEYVNRFFDSIWMESDRNWREYVYKTTNDSKILTKKTIGILMENLISLPNPCITPQYIPPDYFNFLDSSSLNFLLWTDRVIASFNEKLGLKKNNDLNFYRIFNEWEAPICFQWEFDLQRNRFNTLLTSDQSDWPQYKTKLTSKIQSYEPNGYEISESLSNQLDELKISSFFENICPKKYHVPCFTSLKAKKEWINSEFVKSASLVYSREWTNLKPVTDPNDFDWQFFKTTAEGFDNQLFNAHFNIDSYNSQLENCSSFIVSSNSSNGFCAVQTTMSTPLINLSKEIYFKIKLSHKQNNTKPFWFKKKKKVGKLSKVGEYAKMAQTKDWLASDKSFSGYIQNVIEITDITDADKTTSPFWVLILVKSLISFSLKKKEIPSPEISKRKLFDPEDFWIILDFSIFRCIGVPDKDIVFFLTKYLDFGFANPEEHLESNFVLENFERMVFQPFLPNQEDRLKSIITSPKPPPILIRPFPTLGELFKIWRCLMNNIYGRFLIYNDTEGEVNGRQYDITDLHEYLLSDINLSTSVFDLPAKTSTKIMSNPMPKNKSKKDKKSSPKEEKEEQEGEEKEEGEEEGQESSEKSVKKDNTPICDPADPYLRKIFWTDQLLSPIEVIKESLYRIKEPNIEAFLNQNKEEVEEEQEQVPAPNLIAKKKIVSKYPDKRTKAKLKFPIIAELWNYKKKTCESQNFFYVIKKIMIGTQDCFSYSKTINYSIKAKFRIYKLLGDLIVSNVQNLKKKKKKPFNFLQLFEDVGLFNSFFSKFINQIDVEDKQISEPCTKVFQDFLIFYNEMNCYSMTTVDSKAYLHPYAILFNQFYVNDDRYQWRIYPLDILGLVKQNLGEDVKIISEFMEKKRQLLEAHDDFILTLSSMLDKNSPKSLGMEIKLYENNLNVEFTKIPDKLSQKKKNLDNLIDYFWQRAGRRMENFLENEILKDISFIAESKPEMADFENRRITAKEDFYALDYEL
jgi:hypothetical protein